MNRTVGFTKKHQAALAALLGLAIFAPILLRPDPSISWLPAWAGAIVALWGLLGSFVVFWHAGALRTRFLVLVLVALGTAAVCGALLGHT